MINEQDDFIQYCMRNYKTPFFSLSEFKSDMSTVTNIKKMLSRYCTSGKLNERLILNHIITLNNVFGIKPTNIILFYKLEDKFHPSIKTLLMHLNIYVNSDLTNRIQYDTQLKDLLDNF